MLNLLEFVASPPSSSVGYGSDLRLRVERVRSGECAVVETLSSSLARIAELHTQRVQGGCRLNARLVRVQQTRATHVRARPPTAFCDDGHPALCATALLRAPGAAALCAGALRSCALCPVPQTVHNRLPSVEPCHYYFYINGRLSALAAITFIAVLAALTALTVAADIRRYSILF